MEELECPGEQTEMPVCSRRDDDMFRRGYAFVQEKCPVFGGWDDGGTRLNI
ncbi:hypothetical protein IMZ48_31330 [Candidatus Bathyarchaeota archaeon]|nr:hypothetical protein [Candidatus Bathyarchaeota archaeon]